MKYFDQKLQDRMHALVEGTLDSATAQNPVSLANGSDSYQSGKYDANGEGLNEAETNLQQVNEQSQYSKSSMLN